jgi:hypothetical protein
MKPIKTKLSNSLKNFYNSDDGTEAKEKLRIINTNKIFTEETRKKISDSVLKKCENIEERIRLREIGRMGGFGKKGYTDNGIYYQSLLEKNCFEYLENNKIIFEPHKSLPDSSKMSDIYLPDIDLWIELDGINREKKKKYLGKSYDYWIEKLKQYEDKKFSYKIFYDYKEFSHFMESL